MVLDYTEEEVARMKGAAAKIIMGLRDSDIRPPDALNILCFTIALLYKITDGPEHSHEDFVQLVSESILESLEEDEVYVETRMLHS